MSSPTTSTSTEERALKLLGTGVSAEQVAAALGVTPARISQLLADENFAAQVAELKYTNLLSHSQRDDQADKIEDKLLTKIENLLPLMMRPMEAIKAYQVINGAKRRGSQGLQGAVATQTIVQIAVPVQITQKFITTPQNQVVQAGEQQLLTIQSGSLLKSVAAESPETVKAIQDANTSSHSFNSLNSHNSHNSPNFPSQGVHHVASIRERSAGTERNPAGNSVSQASGSKQAESRIAPQISFIPVGS